MEGNLSTGSMIPGASSYGMPVDLQNPKHMHHSQHQHPSFHHHHHQNPKNPQMHNIFPQPQKCDHHLMLPVLDYNKGESDDDEQGFTRMKWTDGMVRLLVTAVSYLGEDVSPDCHGGGKRKLAVLQKKGKWKSISKVLAERGCYVSPQQCEDKFNDLNKRYKRLTDVLGRGTSCKVVENPALLDMMDHLSEKAKEEVRKIMGSKQLFYEEMCSYHNGNRINLPADPALQRSLQLALRSREERDEHDENDLDSDDEDHVSGSCFPKRLKKGMDLEDCHVWPESQGISVDMNQAVAKGSMDDLASRKLQLQEQSSRIQAEMLELKRQRIKWLRFSKKKDRELEMMKMGNKRMKLENERMEMELKRKELELNLN